jgi:hypothetical protein
LTQPLSVLHEEPLRSRVLARMHWSNDSSRPAAPLA